MLRQVSVYAENKKGALKVITGILTEAQINILGSVTNDSAEYGIIRMVVTDPDKAQDLKAPSGGHMSRVIRESAACPARYRLYEDYRLLFDLRAQDASFEAVDYDE